MATGTRAVVGTVVEAVGGLSSLKAREQAYLRDRANLHDVDSALARIRAVSDLLVETLEGASLDAKSMAPFLATLRLHVDALERLGRHKGVIHVTAKEVATMAKLMTRVVERYVATEQQEDAVVELGRAIEAALAPPCEEICRSSTAAV